MQQPNKYVSKYVVCPYYHKHDGLRIFCEGTNSKNSINVVFGDMKEQKRFGIRFCNSIEGCKQCIIHKALDTKYGEGS